MATVLQCHVHVRMKLCVQMKVYEEKKKYKAFYGVGGGGGVGLDERFVFYLPHNLHVSDGCRQRYKGIEPGWFDHSAAVPFSLPPEIRQKKRQSQL